MTKSEQRLLIRNYIVKKMRYRDHCFFGSQNKIAEGVGLSLSTVKRRMNEMETAEVPAEERIERTGEISCRWGKRIPIYSAPGRRLCTSDLQRLSRTTKTPSPSGLRTSVRYRIRASARCSRAEAGSGRRRKLMEQHPEKLSQGVVRRSGEVTPFNAGDAVAAVVDAYGGPIPRSGKPRLGKAAKELLEDGFAPPIVCAAMLRALYRARFDLVDQFALELQNASKGQHLSYAEDRSRIEAMNRRVRWMIGDDTITNALRKEVENELQRR